MKLIIEKLLENEGELEKYQEALKDPDFIEDIESQQLDFFEIMVLYTIVFRRGAGLYILAKYVVFDGVINLSGGHGIQKDICDYNSYSASWAVTGGGGGGSLVLRTSKVITSSGTFVSLGGNRGGGNLDFGVKGGNGKMILLNN
jgi:hypothetical protein